MATVEEIPVQVPSAVAAAYRSTTETLKKMSAVFT